MQENIKNVVEMMKQGGMILYPTDTVWGIGCGTTDAEAVTKVYKIEKRDDSKALICLVDSNIRLQRYARQVPNVTWDLLDMVVKPMTIILDSAISLAPNPIAEDGSITLRITKESFSHELCYRFQKALVGISASVSDEPAAASYCGISREIFDVIDYVYHSRRQECKPHTPSSIIRLAEDEEVTIIRK